MDGPAYNQKLAQRMAVLIAKSDDPADAMDEIARAAEQGGLIGNSNDPRRSNPLIFSQDILLDNPAAGDWMNARLEYQPGYMPEPLKITEIGQLADRLK